ncbi:MAG: DUF58 domain-containing protein [Planctomycetota bacterium]
MADDSRKYLRPEVLNTIEGLELKARLIVEGFLSGLHRSPFRGYSVEFAEHREYVPGDDIRHVDWKVYGKSDRFYIKQYEEETNLRAWIFLDVSESMEYGSGAMSKVEYGRHVAAALAYLVVRQQDAAGLCLFDNRIRSFFPAASSTGHLRVLLDALADVETGGPTGVGDVIHLAAEQIGGRGVVIVISDLLDKPESILRAVRRLRHRGHEVVLFHLLDHDERTFPFERMTLFHGLEAQPQVLADPAALRTQYLKELDEFTRALSRGCRGNRVDFVPLDTRDSLDVALSSYLVSRQGRK